MGKLKALLISFLFVSFFFGANIFASAQCEPVVWDLWAGQHTDVGSVIVWSDTENIYIKYVLDYEGACFSDLHVWVGLNLANMPADDKGTPIPGQFDKGLGGASFNATGLTEYTFVIPWERVNAPDLFDFCAGGVSLYVVTHAEVDMNCSGGEHETAFGGDISGPGPRWWYYSLYQVCCETPPPNLCYQTAFAYGTHVFASDKKANPDNLPSLKLTKQRWGWAIDLKNLGETTWNIYAGAGLNYTSKGTLVGTLSVKYEVDGDGNYCVTLKYDMLQGYKIMEIHVYAGVVKPTTIAPGQYGYVDSWDPAGISSTPEIKFCFGKTMPEDVWLIAHAVVAFPCD